jgi:Scaffold protein Nfu/NifU N terminal
MGQPVAVAEKPTPRPGLVRFELNRSLTGMGHERYTAAEQVIGDKTSAELARRLFATGKVDAVHLYQNVVTVDVKKGFTPDGLADVVENLYIYWVPGREVPVLEAPAEEAPAATPAATGDAPVSAAASRVPAHLLERSRAALERARAKAASGG